jgi:hypothetical protein
LGGNSTLHYFFTLNTFTAPLSLITAGDKNIGRLPELTALLSKAGFCRVPPLFTERDAGSAAKTLTANPNPPAPNKWQDMNVSTIIFITLPIINSQILFIYVANDIVIKKKHKGQSTHSPRQQKTCPDKSTVFIVLLSCNTQRARKNPGPLCVAYEYSSGCTALFSHVPGAGLHDPAG